MANMEDYLMWRGDLTIQQSPFNDVDNAILSELSYVDWEGIIPSSEKQSVISLKEAAAAFFARHEEEELLKDTSYIKEAPFLMRKMAESRRFAKIELSHFMALTDEEAQLQFAAFHAGLPDGTIYVVFKGTDDSLVGWKEDFNMSFISPVPAQHMAVEYVNHTIRAGRKKLRVGGHSKGGNLAIYAAVCCDNRIKRRILEVYNNDGPGFDRKFVESLAYQEMLPKIKTIVPENSVVGMLLEHEEDYMVVKSTQIGLLQHDLMSWQVLGTEFVTVEKVSRASSALKEKLGSWIDRMDLKKREEFVEALFSILKASGANTLSDVRADRFSSASAAFKMFRSMDKETRGMLIKILKMAMIQK